MSLITLCHEDGVWQAQSYYDHHFAELRELDDHATYLDLCLRLGHFTQAQNALERLAGDPARFSTLRACYLPYLSLLQTGQASSAVIRPLENPEPLETPLLEGLRQRTLVILHRADFIMGRIPPTQKTQVADGLKAMWQYWLAVGDAYRAAQAQLAYAQFLAATPFPDRAAALHLLKGGMPQNPIMAAEYAMEIMVWEDHQPEVDNEYGGALALLQKGNHPCPQARVQAHQGYHWVKDRGRMEGLVRMDEAYTDLVAAGFYSHCSDLLALKVRVAEQDGRMNQVKDLRQQHQALHQKMGFGMASQNEELATIHNHYVSGDVGRAVQLARQQLATARQAHIRWGALSFLVNNLPELNRAEEAIGLAQKHLGASPDLADTVLVLSLREIVARLLLLAGRQEEAFAEYRQLYEVYLAQGKVAQAAQALANGLIGLHGPVEHHPLLPLAEETLAMVEQDPSWEGQMAYHALATQLGHVAMQRNQFVLADERFVAAYHRAEALQSTAKKAFGLEYLALNRLQASQQRDYAVAKDALGLFERAFALFLELNQGDSLWKVAFHMGMCSQILARQAQATEDRKQHLAQAEQDMLLSMLLLDRLFQATMVLGDLEFQGGAQYKNDKARQLILCLINLYVVDQARYTEAWQVLEMSKSPSLRLRLSERLLGQEGEQPWAKTYRAWLDQWRNLQDYRQLEFWLKQQHKIFAAIAPEDLLRRFPAYPNERFFFKQVQAALQAMAEKLSRRVVAMSYVWHGQMLWGYLHRPEEAEPAVLRLPVKLAQLEQSLAVFAMEDGPYDLLQAMGDDLWTQHAGLVEALAQHTQPGEVVYLIPHGKLHQAPLHALPVYGEPLAIRNPVGYAPSMASLVLQGQLGQSGGWDRVAIFGDPQENLPKTRLGAQQLATAWGQAPKLGKEVTGAGLAKALQSADLVHFAGHGHYHPAKPQSSGLVMGDDSVFTVKQIEDLAVDATLVVLEGCQTGQQDYFVGDEFTGLVYSFLMGGAAQVIASMWKVSSQSSSEIMQFFHQALLQKQPAILALHHAISRYRASHPDQSLYHWAPYVVYGSQ